MTCMLLSEYLKEKRNKLMNEQAKKPMPKKDVSLINLEMVA